MEHAGAGLTELVCELAPRGPIAVVCGKGNNGGDGFVVARLLRERGYEVDVILLGSTDELQGDAAANCERLPGAPPRQFAAGALDGSSAIVDAILGTGFSGEPREPAAGAISAINEAGARGAAVVACDVPSGVDCVERRGRRRRPSAPAPPATFHAAKPGLWIAPGKAHAGEVRVIEHRDPAGGTRRSADRADRGSRDRRDPAPRQRVDEVRGRERAGLRRVARADRSAVDGVRIGDARAEPDT